MTVRTRRAVVLGLGAALAGSLAAPAFAEDSDTSRGKPPLRHAHAHNDYEHRHPLTEALSHGFNSIEPDIWLVGGQLLIGHDADKLDPRRTLESLYLQPLWHRVRANGGRVYRGYDRTVQLLIDIKSPGDPTYRELARHLERYRSMFTRYSDGRVHRGALTAVVSGDRGARAPMERERVRYAFYDGRLTDLDGRAPASFCPLISDDWTKHFGWRGVGPMPARERAGLRRIVRQAHAAGRQVRFWATPDQPGPARDALWRELLAAGVDYLNTDDLAGLETFLRAHGA